MDTSCVEKGISQRGNAIVVEFARTMEEVGIRVGFKGNTIQLGDEVIANDWKSATWRNVKLNRKKRVETKE